MSADTDNRQKSCEERIADHLAGRLQDFRDFQALEAARGREDYTDDQDAAKRQDIDTDAPDVEDRIIEAQDNYPLGASVSKVLRIDLSTGGPGDWLEAWIDDEDNSVGRIVYHFNDWFDHAERALEGDDYDAALPFVERFTYMTEAQ